MEKIIRESIAKHKQAVIFLEDNFEVIKEVASLFITALNNKGKIIFMGNGGSAADAQHLAAEFVGRFKKERTSLGALALSTNTSTITAIGNDYGFRDIFSRQIEGLAGSNDIVVAISTSGQSKNVLAAVNKAKEMGLKTVAFLGKDGGNLNDIVDIPLLVSSYDTPRIQEMHILAGHIICEIVEEAMCADEQSLSSADKEVICDE